MKKASLAGVIAVFLFMISCTDKKNETHPQRKDITEMVFAPGILEASDQYNLVAQTEGYLVKVKFKEGDNVEKDQLLAIIDNSKNVINSQSATQLYGIAYENTKSEAPALLEIKAKIEAAEAKIELDEQQAERYRRLFESKSVSKIEYENILFSLTNSKASLKTLQEEFQKEKIKAKQFEIQQKQASEINKVLKQQNYLTAIQSGKIYSMLKKAGDYVKIGDVIATIASPDAIYAKLLVDEINMAKLKLGQEVAISLNTEKETTYKAKLSQILPAFDNTSRSFIAKAYFYFETKPKLDIVGTQLEANIIIGTKKNALVIPSSYLNYGNTVILVEDEKNIIVKTGIVSSEWVEITGGLSVEQIITTKEP